MKLKIRITKNGFPVADTMLKELGKMGQVVIEGLYSHEITSVDQHLGLLHSPFFPLFLFLGRRGFGVVTNTAIRDLAHFAFLFRH
jgi:hypothetical protein